MIQGSYPLFPFGIAMALWGYSNWHISRVRRDEGNEGLIKSKLPLSTPLSTPILLDLITVSAILSGWFFAKVAFSIATPFLLHKIIFSRSPMIKGGVLLISALYVIFPFEDIGIWMPLAIIVYAVAYLNSVFRG